MPKRKRTKKYEEDLDHLMHKVRKLKRKLRDRSESASSQDHEEELVPQEAASPVLLPDDWFFPYEEVYYPPDQDTDQPDAAEENYNPLESHYSPLRDIHNPNLVQTEPIEAQQSAQCTLTSALAVASTTALAGTSTSALAGPDTSTIAGTCTSALAGPSTSAIAGTSTSALAGPSTSAIAGTSTSAIAGPTTSAISGTNTSALTGTLPSTSALPGSSTHTTVDSVDNKQLLDENTVNLDEDILQILGDDPSSAMKYGKEIRAEIATRFVHVATEGITKEIRKDLINKYLIPANCVKIGAPKLNPEIKAAISENFAKRDKGIESKQKEMASAISCLGEIITSQLISKAKNNDLLQKLIDLGRILCDLQYADSVTRRNFILFSLKKDLKDHLVNTKIDTCLFGENLTETLKSAKAVIKSGGEMKAAAPKQNPPQYKRLKSTVSRPLNRRGPAPRRPPPGPPPAPTPRGRAPAPRTPFPPTTGTPMRYYRPSYTHQPPQRRY